MRKKEISSLDHYATNGQEKARTNAKDGRKDSLSKSGKASSQRRRRQGNERASGAKKRQNDIPHPAFKLADFLSEEIIEKLRGIK